MKTSAKVLLATMLIVAVVALLLYTPILAESQEEHKGLNGELRRRIVLKRFIKNSVPVEVKVKVVAIVNNILVLDKDSGQLRALLPPAWSDKDGNA